MVCKKGKYDHKENTWYADDNNEDSKQIIKT